MPRNKDITLIAKTNFHGQGRLFGIKTDDRRRHMHVIGKTGMGKTSLLLNMAVSDIRNGNGMAFVDPHGDVAEDLLNYIPPERMKDVIYFNPQDLDFPLAFNVLGDVPRNQRHIVADGLVGVFKKIWADSWGPRLEYILRNAILTLLESEDSTLLDIMRILVDKDFRAHIVYNSEDPMLKSFWLNEFEGYGDKMQAEAIAPIQNKVGQFTSSPLIRNIIGQKKSSFNIRELMDTRKILLMNLSKGAIGEGGAQLLGAMMVTKMQLAAMSRVDIPQEQRQDFFVYIDEFQNFSTDSFAEILSEARKYRLSLILAHQYIEQLSDEVKAAVFGNVGTTIVFRIGAADAEEFEKEFAPLLTVEDFVNLPKWKIYLKLMIDGVTSEPFSADTLPDPPKEEVSLADQIIELSRKQYGNPTEQFAGKQPDDSGEKKSIHMNSGESQKLQASSNDRPKFSDRKSSQDQNRQDPKLNKQNQQNRNTGLKFSERTGKKQDTSPKNTSQSYTQSKPVSQEKIGVTQLNSQPREQFHTSNKNQSSSPRNSNQSSEYQDSATSISTTRTNQESPKEPVVNDSHLQSQSTSSPQSRPERESVVQAAPKKDSPLSDAKKNVFHEIPTSQESEKTGTPKNTSPQKTPSKPVDISTTSETSSNNPLVTESEVLLKPRTTVSIDHQGEPVSQSSTDEYLKKEDVPPVLTDLPLNPILAKKLKEIYSKSSSPFGGDEYFIKAKVMKQKYEVEQESKLPLTEFYDEILGELADKLMKPNPESIEKQEQVREMLKKKK